MAVWRVRVRVRMQMADLMPARFCLFWFESFSDLEFVHSSSKPCKTGSAAGIGGVTSSCARDYNHWPVVAGHSQIDSTRPYP